MNGGNLDLLSLRFAEVALFGSDCQQRIENPALLHMEPVSRRLTLWTLRHFPRIGAVSELSLVKRITAAFTQVYLPKLMACRVDGSTPRNRAR
jgi:hypothetical protein